MLAEREICIVNGPPSCPKQELEKKVVECGGIVVQNPGFDTYCVLADKVNLKVKNIMRFVFLFSSFQNSNLSEINGGIARGQNPSYNTHCILIADKVNFKVEDIIR